MKRFRSYRHWVAQILLVFWLAAQLLVVPAAAAPAAPTDMPTLFVADSLTGLTVTPTTVYWHTSCGGEFYPSHSFLRRKAVRAGVVERRYAPSSCTAGAVASANIAADTSHVYWIEPNGRIMRQPVSDADETVRLFAQTARATVGGYPSCCWIAVDNTHVYWSEGRTIYRKAKSGSERQMVFTETIGNIRELRVGSGGALFYLAGGQLRVLRPTDARYIVSTVSTSVAAYALDANRVYFGNADTSASYLIVSVRISDLGGRQIHYLSNRVGRPRLTNLTVDSTNLYWHDRRGVTAGGPIWRKPLTGDFDLPAVPITAYRNDVSQLQATDNRLFWADQNMGIWELNTGASIVAPPNGDLEIMDVHVTQGIQTNDNRVPLIGEKTTVVRVFVRGVVDSNGPWTDVVAHMQVQGDPTYYGGQRIAIPTGSSDRNRFSDSFTFILSHAATAPGTRTMQVTIGSFSGRPEVNMTNNSVERSLTFGPAQHITWYGLTYGNINTTCVGPYAPDGVIPPFSRFAPHRRYTENLFPVSSLTFLPVPGNPQQLFDNSTRCTAYETAHTYLARFMAARFPAGGERAYLLTPESTGHHGWCCTGSAGNPVARGQDFLPDPGPTMAHEIGHAYGRGHTFDDPNYPRPNGSIGNYLGFRLLSNEPTPRPQIIRGETDATTFFGDIVSYHHPQWISPYTYCLLSNTISRSANRCLPGLDGIPGAAATEGSVHASTAVNSLTYLYVSGYLNDKEQMVLLPFEQLEVIGNPTSPAGKAYSLTLETLNGGSLLDGVFTFDIAPTIEDQYGGDNSQPQTQRTFSFYIPWNPSSDVIRISSAGKQIAERLVSPSSPKFTSFDFTPSGPVKGVQKVNWVVDDSDGDPLTYSVWYSADNGQQWLPVDVDQQTKTTEINFDTLPGSQQALLRVLASDGVNTSTQVSAAFVVPLHSPVVSTTASLDEAGYLLLATSTVYDAEDGAINDPNAYVWTSNWQGEVGRGPWLSAAGLAPGQHTLLLTVNDSDGNVGTATLNVMISNQPDVSAMVMNPTSALSLTLAGLPGIVATFPAGSVDKPVRVTASSMLSPTLDLPGIIGSIFAINAQSEDGSPVSQFAQPFTLVATYEDGLLNGAAETQLALFYENEKSGFWERIDSTVDSEQNRLTAQVDHLAPFALVATPVDRTDPISTIYLPVVAR